MKDTFEQRWDWANKPFSDMASIPAEIHEPVMALPLELTPKGVALLKDVVGLSRVALLVNANDPDAAARYGGWSSG
jgi:hypothetical protein